MTALSMEFNVLPAARRMANARRRLVRVWSSAVMATCAGAVLSGALLRSSTAASGGEATRAIADVRGQIKLSEEALGRETTELTRLRREAETLDLVRRRPDWTRLIASCARAVGENGVLERITLEPATLATPPRVTITGWSREQTDVAASVLVLERTGLLSDVRLTESKRSPFGKAEAVRFSIEANIAATTEAP